MPRKVEDSVIPERLYFKIGEVSKITKVKPYILRYWESEFKIVNPVKSKGRQRVYKKTDVELIQYIKKLLHEEKYTLEGAKKKIKEFKKQLAAKQMDIPFDDLKSQSAFRAIRKELAFIRKRYLKD